MMSRPMVLVFLLMVLIITSQFEWKQLVSEVDSSPSICQKQQNILKKEEAIKEKIILSQEKNIQRLNELVLSLQEQLRQCGGDNITLKSSESSPTVNVIELERQHILED